MKITLDIDSKESIEIGNTVLAVIIGMLEDDDRFETVFLAMSCHPASMVRSAVACKTSLPAIALQMMVDDQSVEVVRQLANNETVLKSFDFKLLHKMILRDVSVAEDIAANLALVHIERRNRVQQLLLQHADPVVADKAKDAVGNSQASWLDDQGNQ